MRPLTARQAKACEEAKGKACVCRCGGALHGRSHEAIMYAEKATGLPWPLAGYQVPLPFDELGLEDEP
jgi:hypothetical protein